MIILGMYITLHTYHNISFSMFTWLHVDPSFPQTSEIVIVYRHKCYHYYMQLLHSQNNYDI